MTRWAFAVVCAFCAVSAPWAQEKPKDSALLIRLDFEDAISGNGSAVSDASAPAVDSKWGKPVGSAGRTAAAKDGQPWKPEHRVAGKSGYAYSFGGDAEKRYIAIPYSEALEFGAGDFSIGYWVKATAASGALVVKTTTFPFFMFHWDAGGRGRFMFRGADAQATAVMVTKKPLNDGVWHHVVFSLRKAKDVRVFVDGKLDAALPTGDLGTFSKKAAIGLGGYEYADGYYDGLMDSFRIYGKALTEEEVAALFAE